MKRSSFDVVKQAKKRLHNNYDRYVARVDAGESFPEFRSSFSGGFGCKVPEKLIAPHFAFNQ